MSPSCNNSIKYYNSNNNNNNNNNSNAQQPYKFIFINFV
jgi:hypothetical protein